LLGCLSQLEHEWGFEYKTFQNDKWVAEKIDLSCRQDKIPFNHYLSIAPFEPSEQKKWLDIAEKEELSVHHLRNKIKKESQYKSVEVPLLPEGKYDIIYVDPPEYLI